MAEYRKGTGPDQLPQGAAKQLNEAQPKGESASDPMAAINQGIQGLPTDISAEIAPRFFGPTDRPDEPVTNGMPFGPGANSMPMREESEEEKNKRLAQQLVSASNGDPAVAEMARRIEGGI